MEQQRLPLAGNVTPTARSNETVHAAPSRAKKRTRNRYVSMRIRVTPSTARWLRALARANAGHLEVRERGAAAILEQAAFCLADCAGRRTGSWEAHVARELLTSSGFISEAARRDISRLHDADRRGHRVAADTVNRNDDAR